MTHLNTSVNLKDHDGLYQSIVELYEGMSEEQSREASATLILLLANHIGEEEVIQEAIEIAYQQSENSQ